MVAADAGQIEGQLELDHFCEVQRAAHGDISDAEAITGEKLGVYQHHIESLQRVGRALKADGDGIGQKGAVIKLEDGNPTEGFFALNSEVKFSPPRMSTATDGMASSPFSFRNTCTRRALGEGA